MRWAQAFGKATVANIGCGFDILGFSVECLYDVVRVKKISDYRGVRLKVLNNTKIPQEPDKNTAGYAIKEYLNHYNLSNQGIYIELDKRLPLGSGMGSSAASSAAALLAINALYDNLATMEELFQIGLKCEKLACGSAHGDNIAPSLYGGITLIKQSEPMKVISLPVPDALFCLLIHPEVEVNTKKARMILPDTVPLSSAVKQWSNIASLITGFFLNNYQIIKDSLTDYIIEKNRAVLIPFFYEMRAIALKHDVFNLSISGSGPTVFSICDNLDKLQNAKVEIEKFLIKKKIKYQSYLFRLNGKGSIAKCMEE